MAEYEKPFFMFGMPIAVFDDDTRWRLAVALLAVSDAVTRGTEIPAFDSEGRLCLLDPDEPLPEGWRLVKPKPEIFAIGSDYR